MCAESGKFTVSIPTTINLAILAKAMRNQGYKFSRLKDGTVEIRLRLVCPNPVWKK